MENISCPKVLKRFKGEKKHTLAQRRRLTELNKNTSI